MKPHEILGVPENASDAELRAAYVNKVKEFPPDRAPEEFERIRDAWETLRNPRKRARALFANNDYDAPLTELLEGHTTQRVYAGPQPWREVLKNK
jgi:curved DNA-binding protein CbpA